MKNALVLLTAILLIACMLFWREVWGLFAGMTVLEAMKQIVTFILHVTVATLAAYAVIKVPEYIKPWMKAFQSKQLAIRRSMRRGRTPQVVEKTPRMNKDRTVSYLVNQLAKTQTTSSKQRNPKSNNEDIRFKL